MPTTEQEQKIEEGKRNHRLLTEYMEAKANNDQERMREIRVEFGLPADE